MTDTTDTTAGGGSEDAEAQALLADAIDNHTGGETGGSGGEGANGGGGGDGDGADDDDGPFDEARARHKIRKINAEAANLRRRLKELEPLAARAKELEDAGKTETQREREAREAAEKRATDAEQRLLRMEIAQDKGLTVAQAKRLVGATREDLEADADELLSDFDGFGAAGAGGGGAGGGGQPGAAVPRRPREALRPGGAPETEPEETDPRKLAARIAERSANR